jgi:hypothetical protein
MRKKYLFIAGLLIACILAAGAAWAWYLYHKPHQGVEDVEPVSDIRADSLFNQFQNNEAVANRQYLGKVVVVNGKISNIQQTDSTLSILLDAGGAMGGINCSMASKQAVHLQTGDLVSIKARCTGYLMDVNLVDGILEQNNAK